MGADEETVNKNMEQNKPFVQYVMAEVYENMLRENIIKE
jgi:hypothetical protein